MRIAIAGYGIEGTQNLEYFHRKYPNAAFTVLDECRDVDVPEFADTKLGPDAFDELESYDMVVRTASLSPRKLASARKVWSGTNEFFAECPTQHIIGITGTKGKGTVCSLIVGMLKAAGKQVHLVGNIGTPAIGELGKIQPEDIVVFELSSFQLWDAEYSPHIAVLLGIEPDHLDIHDSMDDYVDAKARLTRFQNAPDVLIWNPENDIANQIATRESTAISTPYLTKFGAYIQDGMFWFRDQRLCALDEIRIPGLHNQQNACAAITAASYFISHDFADAVRAGLHDFEGLPHRLKYVATVDDVRYYDDSISTTPGSAIAAIASFAEPKIIILGGSDKGADYKSIVKNCRDTETRVIAIGKTGETIAKLCEEYDVSHVRILGGMPEVIATVRDIAHAGDVVILSPASASFDQYKNYQDRGEQFVAAVRGLAN